MPPSPVPPVFASNSFSCPHCGAHSDQTWLKVCTKGFGKDEGPNLVTPETAEFFASRKPDKMDLKEYEELKSYFNQAARGELFIDVDEQNYTRQLINLYLSRCYTCKKITIWIRDRILYPQTRYEVEPNQDLPADIRADFDEARSILDLSPRGAAAILRLCVQKLCKHLGKTGKNINDDIASLVKDGLDLRIQKALDVVRVIGNEAVHPGQMDLKDSRETASKLFSLVNKIAFDTITHPKELNALYGELPESKLKEIEKRDAKS